MDHYIRDTTNVQEFYKRTLVLGIVGWILGRSTEKIVGSRGIIPRLVVNCTILYLMLISTPEMTSHFQSTLPGLAFCTTFFNSQRWDTPHWL